MSVVVASIDIAVPIDEVWKAIMDPRCIARWVTIVDSIDYVDPGPIRPGFRMDQTLHLRGMNFKVRWKLEDLREPNYARWVGTGPARSTAVTEDRLTEHDGHTRFDYHNEFRTPFGPLGAAASKVIVGGIPDKEARASLQRLKTMLETR